MRRFIRLGCWTNSGRTEKPGWRDSIGTHAAHVHIGGNATIVCLTAGRNHKEFGVDQDNLSVEPGLLRFPSQVVEGGAPVPVTCLMEADKRVLDTIRTFLATDELRYIPNHQYFKDLFREPATSNPDTITTFSIPSGMPVNLFCKPCSLLSRVRGKANPPKSRSHKNRHLRHPQRRSCMS